MKPINNFENIEEGGKTFETLPGGGYVCVITAAEDVPEGQFLKIQYDIAEGKHKDHWLNTAERAGFWGGNFKRYYTEKSARFFKGFITAIEKSNRGYKWNWGEKTLVGKRIGLILGEEEYLKKNGYIGVRYNVDRAVSVETITTGDFKVPAKKLYVKEEAPVATFEFAEVVDDGDMPF